MRQEVTQTEASQTCSGGGRGGRGGKGGEGGVFSVFVRFARASGPFNSKATS